MKGRQGLSERLPLLYVVELHLASGNFRWSLNKRCQILLDIISRQSDRFICPSLILKDADSDCDIVPCIYAIVGHESWCLADERHEALLRTTNDFIHRASLYFVPTYSYVHVLLLSRKCVCARNC